MDAHGGTITWHLTANDADFQSTTARVRRNARQTGRDVDREISRGMRSASISLDDFRKDLNNSAQVFRDFQIALRGFQMNAMILGVTAAGGAIIELVGALTAAVGTIYALPGLIAPVIGVFGTLATATYGVSDAISALLKGDMKKLAEEMDRLSPKAQEFVTSFGKINEAFEPIRRAVQEAFFDKLAGQMMDVAAKTLPTLDTGMQKVAKSVNGLLMETGRVMQEPFFQGMLTDTLEASSKATNTLTKAVEPFLLALSGLVEIGLPYLDMLAQWVVKQTELAAIYMNSEAGQQALTDAINLGIIAFQKLGDLIGSVVDLFISLFKVSNEEGLSLIDTLTGIIDQMNAWVNTAEGQELLKALFEATNGIIKELAGIVGDFLLILLKLVKAYNDLDGPVKDVLTHMLAMSVVMSPLISYISAQFASIKLLWLGVREAYQLLLVSINGVKTAMIGAKLAEQGLNMGEIASSGAGKWGLLGATIEKVFGPIKLGFDSLRAGVAGFSTVAGGFSGIMNSIGIAIRGAFVTSPIGWVVLAVTGLVAGFIWLWNNVEGFRNFWINTWNAILDVAKGVGEWFAGPFSAFFAGIWNGIISGVKAVGQFFADVWNGIVAVVTPVVNVLAQIGSIIASVVVGAFNGLIGIVTTVIAVLQPLWDIIGLIGYAIIGLAQIIWTIFVAAAQIIWTVISTLVQIIGVIFYGTLVKIGEFITWVFTNAAAVIGAIFQFIADLFITVWNGIVAFFMPILTVIGDAVKVAFDAIWGVISSVLKTVSDFFISIWNGISDFFKPIIQSIVDFAVTSFENLKNNVLRVFGLIKEYIITPISEVVSYVSRTVGQIATSIGKALTDAYNKVAEWVGKFTSAGGDIINGIVKGIKDGAGKVVEFIKSVCANALDAVKNFFGIKSPSKVMAQMGGYIMGGLGLGIEREESHVVSAAQSAAEGVLAAFSSIEGNLGTMETQFGIDSTMSGSVGVRSLAPSVTDDVQAYRTGNLGAVINQTNNVYTDLDMEQVNRSLTWELSKI